MSTATQESPAKEAQSVIPPFGIEADHPRNSDLLIQVIPNLRLRSTIDGTKAAKDFRSGDLKVPKDQAVNIGDFPKTPGMQLHVNPAELTYVVIDPLENEEELQRRVVQWLKIKTGYRYDKLRLQEKMTGKLDKHQMKTLCREMVNLVQAGEAKKCRGSMPDMDDVNNLPGHYLLNPGSRVMNTQPKYEKDLDSWIDRLANSGG